MWNKICDRMPERLRRVLLRCPGALTQQVQEIRLRAGQPLIFVTAAGPVGVNESGCGVAREKGLVVYAAEVTALFLALCEGSVYAHTAELRQGFLTTPEGCRVGVAGTAITENGIVTGLRDPVGLALRIPRDLPGAATGIFDKMVQDGQVRNTLILSPPGGGKTTVLRDIARRCCEMDLQVSVIDSRFELGGFDLGCHCDVLSGYPKAAGVLQALRTLAPQVILCDEIGSAEDVSAVENGFYSGVSFVLTAHGSCREDLHRRPVLRLLLERCGIDRVLILHGAGRPGVLRDCVEMEALR